MKHLLLSLCLASCALAQDIDRIHSFRAGDLGKINELLERGWQVKHQSVISHLQVAGSLEETRDFKGSEVIVIVTLTISRQRHELIVAQDAAKAKERAELARIAAEQRRNSPVEAPRK